MSAITTNKRVCPFQSTGESFKRIVTFPELDSESSAEEETSPKSKTKLPTPNKIVPIKCSSCHLPISPEVDSRAEIKCSAPPASLKSPWVLNWAPDWSATLHAECWERTLSTARSRSKKITAAEKKMIREGEKTVERFDSLQTLGREAVRTAKLLTSAKHCICFTGAGISTSAGIGDYRGKDGKWTQEERQQQECSASAELEEGVAYEKLRPTYTHEGISLLVERGLIKHVISQNCDGLNLLSGLPPDRLSELHGNVFLETCEKCGHVYERSYYTLDDTASLYYEELQDSGKTNLKRPRHAKKCPTCGLSHRTGRKCQVAKCGGFLKDTIINFGDMLQENILSGAEEQAKKNDLCLSLGSTMQVNPACDLVVMGEEPLRLAVCNRQETAFDHLCYEKAETESGTGRKKGEKRGEDSLGVRVFGNCDVFMREVLKQLLPPVELEEWEQKRTTRLLSYDSKRQQ